MTEAATTRSPSSPSGSPDADLLPARADARLPAANSALARWVIRAPLLLISIVLIASALVPIARTLAIATPARPWDSAEIVEGARFAAGLPIYEDPERGHATLMYGPLAPYLYGAIFKVTGPSNFAPRVVTVVCVIALLALLIIVARRVSRFPPWMIVLALAVLLAADSRTEYRYAHVRPDVLAILLSALALVAMYRGQVRRSAGWYAAGVVGVLVAVLAKQQMATFAFVPALPLLLDRELTLGRRLVMAAVPPLAVALMIALIKLTGPLLYFYMVALAKGYTVFPKLLVRGLLDFAISVPLFLALMLVRLRPGAPLAASRSSLAWQWALCSVAIAIPSSALSFAKLGAASNSWLPALLAVLFVCMLCFAEIDAWLSDRATSFARRLALSSLLALLVLLCFPGFKSSLIPPAGDADYKAIIAQVRALPPGRVEAPEDPTIALYGRGTFGRHFYTEYDARPVDGHWPTSLPTVLARDLRAADYLVEVDYPAIDFFHAEDVARLGFTPVSHVGRYTLWRRKPAAVGSAAPTTSLR